MKLAALLGVPDVHAAVLVGEDGLALEAIGEDAELLAAELAELHRPLARASRRLGAGEITRVSFGTARFDVLALRAGSVLVAVSLPHGADTRPAQLELARVATALTETPGDGR